MRLTHPLLLNAKAQDKPYKIRDRDSMCLRVSTAGSKTWKFDYRLDGKACTHPPLATAEALFLSDFGQPNHEGRALWIDETVRFVDKVKRFLRR